MEARVDGIGDRDTIVRVLAENDLTCPSCEYNLRGLTGVHCPECNQKLVLRVGLAEPRLGSFIAGLVGIASGLGFCTILFIYFLVYMYFRGWRSGPRLEGIVPLAVGMPTGGVLLWLWIRFRGRLARLSPRARSAWIVIVWVVSLVCPVLFTVLIK